MKRFNPGEQLTNVPAEGYFVECLKMFCKIVVPTVPCTYVIHMNMLGLIGQIGRAHV